MYYIVTVRVQFETDKGKISHKSEKYLVLATSITDAEAIVTEKFKDYPQDFEVKSVVHSKILDVYAA
jgi:hypothetical protein